MVKKNDGDDWIDHGFDPDERSAQDPTDQLPRDHLPPVDNYPKTYSAGPPSVRGGSTLESSDYLAIFAAIIPGLGQMIMGQTVKGLVVLGVALVTCSGFGLLSIASMVDAYLVAMAQKRRPVGEWEFFPDYQETFNTA